MRKNLLLALLMISALAANATDYYWVGGSGNWSDVSNHWATSSGGGTFQVVQPTAADNVYFDANSFTVSSKTVTVNVTNIYCKNMDWTGATQSPTFNGNGNTLTISGSLTLISAMTFTAPAMTFNSTSTGNTITSGGQNLGGITFNGVGGAWTQQDAFALSSIVLTNGSFSTNNNNMTLSGELSTSGTGTKSLTLGTSTITLTMTLNVVWDLSANTGLTFSGASSTIICTGYRSGCCGNYFTGGSQVYNNISFTGTGTGNTPGWVVAGNNTFNTISFASNGEFTGSNTINSLTFSAGGVYLLTAGTTQTVTSYTGSGTCISPISIGSTSSSVATLSVASGSVTTAYATLTYIAATGGASFTANSATDGGHNTGWTINALAPTNLNLYWIGGTGNWADGSHWSTSSGGSAYGCIPTATDNVYFDANSFTVSSKTVTVNTSIAYCKSMDWTGATQSPTFNGNGNTLTISASLTLISAMTFTAPAMTFNSTSTGNTITSGGQNLGGITFNGVGGAWTQQDAFALSSIVLTNGSFSTNNNNMTLSGELSTSGTGTKSLTLGTSTITLTMTLNVVWDLSANTGLTFSGASSTIICTGYRSGCCGNYFTGGSQVYNNISFTGTGTGNTPGWVVAGNNTFNTISFASNGEFTGSNTINSLTFSAGGVYLLTAGTTQTVTSYTGSGTCISPISIGSTSSSVATLSVASGSVTTAYATLTYIAATGGASFTANSATDGGHNTGWTINALAPTNLNLYWIGGTGNWADGSHWSTSSGGSAYGCIPTATDNVFFDANSFTVSSKTITVNTSIAYCKSMDWTGATQSPTFNGNGQSLYISGSLTLISAMTFTAPAITFNSTSTGNTITSNGLNIGGITLDGVGGGWGLQDNATMDNLTLTNGSFNTNNRNMTFTTYGELLSSNTNVRSLTLGTSTITMGSIMNIAWDLSTNTNLTFSGASSTIICTGYRASCCGNYFKGGGLKYGSISFTGTGVGSTQGWTISGNNTFTDVSFAANGYLTGSNTINNLTFSSGYVYMLGGGTTQTINVTVNAIGTGIGNISIQSDNSSPALISKPFGTVCMDYLSLTNLTATGGAIFNAGTHSSNVSGNTGFLFTSGCVASTAPYLWNGTTSTDWFTASNWSSSAVPTSSDDAVIVKYVSNQPVISSGNTAQYNNLAINAGASLNIAGKLNGTGTTTNNGSLIVNPGGAIIGNYAGITGTTTLQESVIAQRGWRGFANPFSTATNIATVASNNGITIGTSVPSSGLTDSRTFSNSSNAWSNVTGTTWAANTPYALFIRGLTSEVTGSSYTGGPTAFTYSVSGTLNGNSVTVPSANVSNFSLVGNPYAAPVNSQALTGGTAQSYYLYTITQGGNQTAQRTKAGSWSTVLTSDNATPIPVLGVIAVKTAGNFSIGTSDINTTNSAATGLFGIDTPIPHIELQVEQNGNYQDKLFVRLDPAATANGTDKIDLDKFYNDNVNVYSISDDKNRLAVDARNVLNIIPLGISALAGDYNFKLNSNQLPDGTTVFLKDKLLNTQTELKIGDTYNFSISADASTYGEERFELLFNAKKNNATAIDNGTGSLTAKVLGNITSSNLVAVEISGSSGHVNIAIKGMNGKSIGNVAAVNGIQYIHLGNAGKGMLILQVSDDKSSVIQKLIKL